MSTLSRVAAACVVTCACACDARSKLNHFVVPVGYTGPIALVSHPTFLTDSFWDGKRYIHSVPNSGVVCVKDDSVVRPRFRLTAAYSDGSAIYSNYHGLPGPPNRESARIEAVGSWGSSTEGSYLHWLGVGTEAETKALQDRFFGAGEAIQRAMPPGVTISSDGNRDFSRLSQYCSKNDT